MHPSGFMLVAVQPSNFYANFKARLFNVIDTFLFLTNSLLDVLQCFVDH